MTLSFVDTCVRLAEVWSAATAGSPPDALLARFGPEEQFILELVSSVFAPQRPTPGGADAGRLGRLLDETAVTPPPL